MTTTEQVPQKQGRGCFFYGCLVALLLFIVVGASLFFGTRYAVNRLVANFTETSPRKLPEPVLTEAEAQGVILRYNRFRDQLREGTPSEELRLNSDEINALIGYHPEFSAMKDRVFVSLAGSNVTSEISLPGELLPLSALKGRYINGTLTIVLGLDAGQLEAHVVSAELSGKELPKDALVRFQSENLLEDVNEDEDVRRSLNRLQEIKVEEGELRLIPK